jgi:hypothetical protein
MLTHSRNNDYNKLQQYNNLEYVLALCIFLCCYNLFVYRLHCMDLNISVTHKNSWLDIRV